MGGANNEMGGNGRSISLASFDKTYRGAGGTRAGGDSCERPYAVKCDHAGRPEERGSRENRRAVIVRVVYVWLLARCTWSVCWAGRLLHPLLSVAPSSCGSE